MNQHEDKELESAMSHLAKDQEPSEALMRNLRVMASTATRTRRAWWQNPRLAAFGAGAAALAIIAMTLTPAKASAKTYDMLIQAANTVHNFQLVVNSKEKGKQEHVSIAGTTGKFVIKTSEGPIIRIAEGEMEVYDPGENTVTHIKSGGMIDGKMIQEQVEAGIAEGLKEMNLQKMLKDYERQYGRENIHISPIVEEGGKAVYRVLLSSPKEPQRVTLTVDAKSDLPVRIIAEEKGEKSGWSEEANIEMKYGADVDPNLLEPDFPAKAKHETIDIGKLMSDGFKEGMKTIKP